MHKKITIQRSGGQLIVSVDDGSKREQQLAGGDWDGLRVALIREGCAERQILEVLEILETQNTVTVIADTER